MGRLLLPAASKPGGRRLPASRAVASFDSATGMLRALSRFLAGQDAPLLGQLPGRAEPAVATLLGGVNRLPRKAREWLYATSGVAEAVPRDSLAQLNADDLAEWVVEHYPKRRYPVVFLGSSNGALVHLAALIGAPWLPQTLLIPVRRELADRDDARAEMDLGRDPGRDLLDANPQLALHHMHDPNQDRLMIAGMSYFRVKWQNLPEAYRRFLRDHLAPGGVVVSVECDSQWPVTTVGDRHWFQFGAKGGATQDEYQRGGPRVEDLLRRYGATRRSWDPPEPDQRKPEAEWGFDPSWLDDVREVVERRGFGLRRLRFADPDDLSAPVAEIHRNLYRQSGFRDDRLLLDCFLLLDPMWTLRTRSVPYWLTFNTRPSLDAAHAYLDAAEPYDEIRLMLFAHGTDSIGLASASEWSGLLERAHRTGTFLGVDPDAFPRDFAVFARAHRELTRVRGQHPVPDPVPLAEVEPQLRDRVDWT